MKIWNSSQNNKFGKYPVEILSEYAKLILPNTQNKLLGIITEVSNPDGKIVYALYLSITNMKDVSYRLMEIIQPEPFPYPVIIRLFPYSFPSANPLIQSEEIIDELNCRNKIEDYIKSPITKGILGALINSYDLKEESDKQFSLE